MKGVLIVVAALTTVTGGAGELVLPYHAPASTWNEALPLGNGRLGAMAYSFPYLPIGSLLLRFDGHDWPTGYRRALSLEDAVFRVEYDLDGVRYARETFVSLADDVMVVRLTASKPGSLSFSAFFDTTAAYANTIVFHVSLADRSTTQSRIDEGNSNKADARARKCADLCCLIRVGMV